MMTGAPSFFEYTDEYGIFDECGELIGLREDAPEDAKKSYEDLKKCVMKH